MGVTFFEPCFSATRSPVSIFGLGTFTAACRSTVEFFFVTLGRRNKLTSPIVDSKLDFKMVFFRTNGQRVRPLEEPNRSETFGPKSATPTR